MPCVKVRSDLPTRRNLFANTHFVYVKKWRIDWTKYQVLTDSVLIKYEFYIVLLTLEYFHLKPNVSAFNCDNLYKYQKYLG